MPNTVVLYSEDPSFFEREGTLFNRRGVEVFGAMDLDDLNRLIATLPVKLVISRGSPAGLPEPVLRTRLGTSPQLLVLGGANDDPLTLQTYERSPGSTVLIEPYGCRIVETTQTLLAIPVRHYVRMLVQLHADGGGFGYCQNVSMTGMLIELKRQLTVGSEFPISFMLPNIPGMIRVTARVVRHASSLRDAHRYGLHFLDVSPEDHERLSQLDRTSTH
jgi:hypothetical protein